LERWRSSTRPHEPKLSLWRCTDRRAHTLCRQGTMENLYVLLYEFNGNRVRHSTGIQLSFSSEAEDVADNIRKRYCTTSLASEF